MAKILSCKICIYNLFNYNIVKNRKNYCFFTKVIESQTDRLLSIKLKKIQGMFYLLERNLRFCYDRSFSDRLTWEPFGPSIGKREIRLIHIANHIH